MKNKSVVVIGSGFSGLSVASNLAKEGYDVSVFEKNDTLGGRARSFSSNGFTFDMGPSWYWMPDVFESYFAHFGKQVSDYYDLIRLDPSYSVFFDENHRMDIPASFDELCNLFDKYEEGSSSGLKKFLNEAKYKYEVGMRDMVYKPGQSITEFMDWRVISGAMRLQLLTPLSKHVRKYFSNKYLLELLEFPVLFLGAKPSKTPAMYSMMNYADIMLGTWYPKGGMIKIIDGMVSLANELGVKFHTNSPVTSIRVENGVALGIVVNDILHEADVVVSSADYHHTDSKLLKPKYRNYSESYWDTRTMAPSSLIYFLGIDKKLVGLEHHNLFFDADFNRHAEEIYDDPKWPQKPLFYVSATSKTDNSVAPDGCENLFILIPTAPGLIETEAIQEEYFDMVIERLERLTCQNVREHIVYKRNFACSDFINEYNSFKGNAYGLANTLRQTAVLKPKLKSKKVNNLYYTGQLTVPGPGVPPSLISGRIVAREVQKNYAL
ncbi:phytoene desaturase [Cryomorpha ignava]|uniref:Phytoene desaturase n=1 Tax=Cryomorpha ignava TaxID=101383 RepID=A0A7K3WN08_9FLAO|nr:phytoene desaturase family protein [Cryomorpha ignava]NEN22085.1 phytoene desaturase [Cryomorpha ignava]